MHREGMDPEVGTRGKVVLNQEGGIEEGKDDVCHNPDAER